MAKVASPAKLQSAPPDTPHKSYAVVEASARTVRMASTPPTSIAHGAEGAAVGARGASKEHQNGQPSVRCHCVLMRHIDDVFGRGSVGASD